MNRALSAFLLLLAACDPGPAAPLPAVDPSLRAKVELSTGWTFKTEPVFERIDRRQLLARLEAKLDGAPGERMAATGRALQTLGLLPRGYDLVASLKRMYTQEILALYDLKERKVFLVREALEKPPTAEDLQLQQAGKLTMREVTIAHEMVHALQHQHDPLFDLLEGLEPDLDDVRGALHALAEGEATIHMYALVGLRDAAPIARSIEADGASKFPGEPDLLRRVLFFPYAAGTRFAGARAQNGPALHAAPPLSTEQILHPERKDPPVAILLPDLSREVGGGRALATQAVMGEAFLAPALGPVSLGGGFDDPSLGWGGDRLHLYEKSGADPVVVIVTRWDTPAAAAEARLRAGRKEGWVCLHADLQVAIVVGLPVEEGKRIAQVALERAVAKPFGSVEELRAILKGEKPR
jgi:hypothetical protein